MRYKCSYCLKEVEGNEIDKIIGLCEDCIDKTDDGVEE